MPDNSAKIVITAVDNTKAGIDSATKGIQTLSGAISSIPGLGGVAASLAAFAGAGALKTLIGDTISAAAAMDDLAEKTGASVEKLGGLAKVAKISGVDFGIVEQSLIKLSKALAGVDEETQGTAGHALAAIGLEAQKLRDMDPADALKEISDALSEYADGTGKTALMQDLLGKSAAQLLPYLKDLADAQELQGTLTTEQAAAAEELEKAWNRTNAEGAAWAKSIVISMLPALGSLLDFLNETKRGIVQLGSSLAVVANDVITFAKVAAVAVGAGFTGEGQAQIGELLASRERFKAAFDEDTAKRYGNAPSVRDKIDKALAGGGPQKPRLNYTSRVPRPEKAVRSGRSPRAASGARERDVGSVNDYDAILTERIARAIEQTDIIKAAQLTSELAKLDELAAAGLDPAIVKAVRDDLTGAAKTAANEVKRLNDLLADTPTEQLEKLRADMLLLTAALESAKITEEQYAEATMTRIGAQKDAVKQTLSDIDQFAVQAAKNTQDAFADFLFDPFAEGVQGMLQGFGTAIRRMIANAVAADLGKRLFGDIGSGNGIGGLLGEGFKFLSENLPSFAIGTPYVPRDMIAQIHRGERIIPAAQNQSGGGHTIVVNQYISGSAGAAEVRRSGAELSRGVLSAISGASRYR